MNERIKELALEAKLGPALLLHHWGKIDALTDSEQEDLEKIEILNKKTKIIKLKASYYYLKIE